MGRRMPAVRWVAPALASLMAALLLSACGGDDDVASSPTIPTAAAIVDPAAGGAASAPPFTGDSTAATALPDLQVVRVASNEIVALRTLAPADKPMVLWFWAPHCTFCRGEAPELLEFEKTYGKQLTILGLGAQDDYDQAVDFLADTGTENLEMVWDRTGKSWLHFKVTNQPTVVVVDADGKVTKKWFRDFDA
jgi:thiol-disulfide isomerase/thioredoxin